MKKYSVFIIIFLTVLLVAISFLYFNERDRIIIETVFPGERMLEIKPEILEQDINAEYVIEGLLMENKIEEEEYIVIRVDMNRFFIDSPVIMKDVQVRVSRQLPIVTVDENDARMVVTRDDLMIFDRVVAFVNLPISAIIEDPEFIAHSFLMKTIQNGLGGSL